MSSAAEIGRTGLLQLKVASGSLVTIAEVTNIDIALGLDTHEVTPLGNTRAELNIPGAKEATFTADLNFINEAYSEVTAATDLVTEWKGTLAVPDWRIIFPDGLALDMKAFLTSLTVNMAAHEPQTGSIGVRVIRQPSSGELFDWTTGSAGSAATTVAVIGSGLELRVSDTTADAVVIITEMRNVSFNFAMGEVDVSGLQSGGNKEFIRGTTNFTMDFAVNLRTAAVGTSASHMVEAGSIAQPSLYEHYKNRIITTWQLAWEHEGSSPRQLWDFDGILETGGIGMPLREAMLGNYTVQGTGPFATNATEAD